MQPNWLCVPKAQQMWWGHPADWLASAAVRAITWWQWLLTTKQQHLIAFVGLSGNLLKHNLYWLSEKWYEGPMALEFLSKLIHLGQRRSHCRIRPESHSARLISSQSRSVSSLFQLVWKLTQSEYDFVEGFREILLFFIKHCSSYCHIHCFRFSVQIVFLYCFLV